MLAAQTITTSPMLSGRAGDTSRIPAAPLTAEPTPPPLNPLFDSMIVSRLLEMITREQADYTEVRTRLGPSPARGR
jgi:hypothetical protein